MPPRGSESAVNRIRLRIHWTLTGWLLSVLRRDIYSNPADPRSYHHDTTVLVTVIGYSSLGVCDPSHPLGALKPRLWAMNRLKDVRATTRFFQDGFRNGRAICESMKVNAAP